MKKKKDIEKHRMILAEERRKSLQIKTREKKNEEVKYVRERSGRKEKKKMKIEARKESKE